MADNNVKIKLSLDGADSVEKGLRGVGDAASDSDSKLSKLGSGIAGAGKVLGGVAVAAGAAGVAIGSAVVGAYASAQQSVGGIETLFKGSADQMKNYAAQAYQTAGLSADAYMQQATSTAAAMVQALGGNTAAAADLTNRSIVDMSDNANKMGTSLTDIQNAYQGFAKQNFTMLDNLKLGYGGTQEEMQRLLSDAEKLPGAMGQKFDLSNYADVVTAIGLIQEQMGIAGTTAEEASKTISGSWGSLQGAFNNLLVSMGSANDESMAFLDLQTQAQAVVSGLQTVIGNVAPVVDSLGQSFETLGPQLGDILSSLVETVSGVIPQLLTAGTAMIGGLVQGVSSALPSLITALVPGLVGLVEMVATVTPGLLDAGIQAVVALATGIGQALPTLIPVAIQGILGMVDAIISNLPALLQAGLQLITGLAQGLLNAIPILIAALPGIISGIVDFLVTGIPMVMDAWIQLLMGIVDALPQIIDALTTALPQVIDALVNGLLSNIPTLITAAFDLFINLAVGIVEALPQILEALLGYLPVFVETMIGMIPTLISTIFQVFVSLVSGIVSAIPALVGAIATMLPQFIGKIGSFGGSLIGKMGEVIGNMAQGVASGAVAVFGAIGSMVSGVVDRVLGIGGAMLSAGKNIIQKFIDGIGSMIGAVGNAVGKVVSGALSFLPHSPADKGPLSGAGWANLAKSGAALVDQWVSGAEDQTGRMAAVAAALAAPFSSLEAVKPPDIKALTTEPTPVRVAVKTDYDLDTETLLAGLDDTQYIKVAVQPDKSLTDLITLLSQTQSLQLATLTTVGIAAMAATPTLFSQQATPALSGAIPASRVAPIQQAPAPAPVSVGDVVARLTDDQITTLATTLAGAYAAGRVADARDARTNVMQGVR